MNFLLNLDYQQGMIYFPITRPCYYPSLRKSADRKFIVTQDGIISDSDSDSDSVSHYVSIPSRHIACRYSTVGIIYIYFTS